VTALLGRFGGFFGDVREDKGEGKVGFSAGYKNGERQTGKPAEYGAQKIYDAGHSFVSA
jgi:hypothetical protein